MTIEEFLNTESKCSTCITVMRKSVSRAIEYIIAWTDCSQDEAESIVSDLKTTQLYKQQMETFRRVKQQEERKRTMTQSSYTLSPEWLATYRKNFTNPTSETEKKPEINKKEEIKKLLYIFDADNHINEGLRGIEHKDERDVFWFYTSQDGMWIKLLKKNLGNVVLVEPGDQAVDNKILKDLDKIIKTDEYDSIFVISHDKGYDEPIQKMRCRYKIKKSNLDRRDIFCED